MLHAVAQLAQHALGHVQRILGDEVDAHALGADQAHHLLDLVQQRLGRVIEQQVGLVEEEDHLRLGLVAHLGQLLEEFREQPQQEGAVEFRRVHQLVGHQDVDDAAPVRGGAHHVRELQHGLAEEALGALLLQREQVALDGADGGRRDVAVLVGELLGVFAHVLQHGAQVLAVQQQQAVVIRHLEGEVEHAFLRVVEAQHARQQQRPHVGDGGANRVPLLAIDIPERDREARELRRGQAVLLQPGLQLGAHLAWLGDAGEIPLHIGHEHRHADGRELFGQALQGDGLAGAGGTGDEAVTVAQRRQQHGLEGVVLADQQGGKGVGHRRLRKGMGRKRPQKTPHEGPIAGARRGANGRLNGKIARLGRDEAASQGIPMGRTPPSRAFGMPVPVALARA